MIPLSLIAADDAMLAITTFLANPSPLFTPATQQALRLAQEAAYAALPEVHPPSLAEYLTPDVPVGVHLGNPPGFRPNFGEWLTFWNEDGSPEPQRMNQILALGGLALVPLQLPILQQIPAVQLPLAAPGPLVAPVAPPATPQCFSSAEHFLLAVSRLPVCFMLNGAVLCCRTPISPHNLCSHHLNLLSQLTGNQGAGAANFASPSAFFRIQIPILADLAAARGIPQGELPLSSLLLAFNSLLDYTAPAHPKVKTSPFAAALDSPAKTPLLDALSPIATLSTFVSSTTGMTVENSVSSFSYGDHPSTHYSHHLWPLYKVMGTLVWHSAFSPPGTIAAALLQRGNVITDLRPLTTLFAKYGIGASPAFADLFGQAINPFWLQHSNLYPDLTTKLSAGACSVKKFLDLFVDYRALLTQTSVTFGKRNWSISEEIFNIWATDNSLSQEFIADCVRQGLHLHFNVNQWLEAVFTSIQVQAVQLLQPRIGHDDPQTVHIMMTVIQAARNVHSFPGLVLPLLIDSRDGTNLANWKPASSKELFPIFSADSTITSPDALLRATVEHATAHLNTRKYRELPTSFETTAFTEAAKNGNDLVAAALAPARAHASDRSAAKPSGSASRVIAPSASSTQNSGRKRDASQAFSSPPDSDSQFGPGIQEWLDSNRRYLLNLVPQSLKGFYENGLRARLRSGPPVQEPSSRPDLLAGWKAIPLYRLTPKHSHNDIYCCACGTKSSSDNGHMVYDCPLIVIPGTHFGDIPRVNNHRSSKR